MNDVMRSLKEKVISTPLADLMMLFVGFSFGMMLLLQHLFV